MDFQTKQDLVFIPQIMVLTVSTTSSESSANTTESTRMDTVGNANTMHKWEWLKYWWFQNWNLKIIDGINQIGNT